MAADEGLPDITEVRVERREIDGVPVFFGSETQGPLYGGLVFRVGQADEALIERGLTHLVEHLAFAPLTDRKYANNGTVAMVTTSFEVRGEPDEVVDFVNGIARSLADLQFDRLEIERRVLRTEDQRRSGSLFSLANYLRFGPAAHGTIDCPELGLPGATAESVDAWRRRWFTRGNAVLWFSGEPPDGLDLSPLADGEHILPPEPEPYPYRYPAWYPGADGYIAVSMLGGRTLELWAAQSILRERLYDRLRASEGRSYEVSVDHEALTNTSSSLFLLTDTLPEEAERVRDAVSAEISRLVRRGPEQGEIDHLRTMMRRTTSEPGFPGFLAERFAWHTLKGIEPQGPEELDAELAAMTPEAVGRALREAADAALWLVPRAIGMYDQRVVALPYASDHSVQGRLFERPSGYPAEAAGDQLVVGEAGVSMLVPDRDPSTVEFAACRAVQAYEDGSRALWGADGIRLFIHPGDWSNGDGAVSLIDKRLDPALVVNMGEPSGYAPPEPEPAKPSGFRLFRRRG